MKEHKKFIKSSFDTIFESNPHSRWTFLKYEIRKFTIKYSIKAKERCEKIRTFEENLRTLEQNLDLLKISLVKSVMLTGKR